MGRRGGLGGSISRAFSGKLAIKQAGPAYYFMSCVYKEYAMTIHYVIKLLQSSWDFVSVELNVVSLPGKKPVPWTEVRVSPKPQGF